MDQHGARIGKPDDADTRDASEMRVYFSEFLIGPERKLPAQDPEG